MNKDVQHFINRAAFHRLC